MSLVGVAKPSVIDKSSLQKRTIRQPTMPGMMIVYGILENFQNRIIVDTVKRYFQCKLDLGQQAKLNEIERFLNLLQNDIETSCTSTCYRALNYLVQ